MGLSFLPQKPTSTIFILALAGTDFITCLVTIPFTIAMEALHFNIKLDFFCKFYHFLITTTVPFSAFVMVAIAVDRYLCICHPFLHWMTERRAKIIITCLAIFVFLFGGIICAHYSVYDTKEEQTLPQSLSEVGITPGIQTDTLLHTEVTKGFRHGASTWLKGSNYPSYNVSTTGHTTINPLGPTGEETMKQSGWVVTPLTTSFNASILIDKTFTATLKTACDIRVHTINQGFFDAMQKVYSGFFLVCCVTVLILYSLIYHSVITQRRKKLRIRSATCCFLWDLPGVANEEQTEVTTALELSQANGNHKICVDEPTVGDEVSVPRNGSSRAKPTSRSRLERMRIANIKTAAMLFVVTLVFIFSFLPAWLIALKIIHTSVIVFYMYFLYNVVNPIIYAFMNQTFRTELRKLFRCNQ